MAKPVASSGAVEAEKQVPFKRWDDLSERPEGRIQHNIDECGTESIILSEGDILSFINHHENPDKDWVGRAEGFKQWTEAKSSRGWKGDDHSLIQVQWFQKVNSSRTHKVSFKSGNEDVWMEVPGLKEGKAYTVEDGRTVSGVVAVAKLEDKTRFKINGRSKDFREIWDKFDNGQEGSAEADAVEDGDADGDPD